jgi:hypothetical protein
MLGSPFLQVSRASQIGFRSSQSCPAQVEKDFFVNGGAIDVHRPVDNFVKARGLMAQVQPCCVRGRAGDVKAFSTSRGTGAVEQWIGPCLSNLRIPLCFQLLTIYMNFVFKTRLLEPAVHTEVG